jgi:hypothetical protein
MKVWKEDAELLEHELTFSSDGESEGLSAHGSTGSPVWSGNCSSGGAPEPAPVSKPTESIAEDVVKKYTWDEIRQFTDGLSSRQLGKGSFGTVYLGKLENGREVAVKILDPSSQQGMPEFLNEVLFWKFTSCEMILLTLWLKHPQSVHRMLASDACNGNYVGQCICA